MSIYDLGDFQISNADTKTGTSLNDLSLSIVTISARLAYGSGGTSIIAIVQTSINQGTTWIDIARFDFSTTGLEKVVTLTKGALMSPYTVVPLAAEGTVNGILGDTLRAVVTSTGTYSGSTVLAVRAAIR